MRTLAHDHPVARDERAASAVLHDDVNARVVAFRLRPGQKVPPHSSRGTVIVQVTEGEGRFIGDGGAQLLRAGQGAVFEPGETHAIEAGEVELRFVAVITPSPGARAGG